MGLFELEALPARHGDCLILHYGPEGAPKRILIDGGPAKVYQPTLRPRLEELRAAELAAGRESLRFEMLLVSHIDDDHINGILELFEELGEHDAANRPLPYRFTTLWHNSFDDLLSNGADELRSAALDEFQAARPSHAGGGLMPAEVGGASGNGGSAEIEPGGEAVAASVPQGRELRRMAKRLGIPVNRGLPRGDGKPLVIARADHQPVDLGHGVTFRVLGPSFHRIERLRKTWDKELIRRGLALDPPPTPDEGPPPIENEPPSAVEPSSVVEPAAFVDRSVFNLASLIVLAEHREGNGPRTRMLLPGDARGDDILDGLEEAGLLADFRVEVEERGRRRRRPPRRVEAGGIHVDLLKLPHHGSDRNVTTDFFRQVRADRYVVSGDGRHGNPEPATFQMIFDARRDDGGSFTLELTYGIDELHEKYPKGELKRVLAEAEDAGMDFRLSVGPPA